MAENVDMTAAERDEVVTMGRLVSKYSRIVRATAGCGDRAAQYRDPAMKEIDEHIAEHPDNKKLPEMRPARQLAGDDGNDGAKNAFGSGGSSYWG